MTTSNTTKCPHCGSHNTERDHDTLPLFVCFECGQAFDTYLIPLPVEEACTPVEKNLR